MRDIYAGSVFATAIVAAFTPAAAICAKATADIAAFQKIRKRLGKYHASLFIKRRTRIISRRAVSCDQLIQP
jgi:hypothetical protein